MCLSPRQRVFLLYSTKKCPCDCSSVMSGIVESSVQQPKTHTSGFPPVSESLTEARQTLGQVLGDLGVHANDRVQPRVGGPTIPLLDKWGYSLGTKAARLNSVIGTEPKSLGQICTEARYHIKGS